MLEQENAARTRVLLQERPDDVTEPNITDAVALPFFFLALGRSFTITVVQLPDTKLEKERKRFFRHLRVPSCEPSRDHSDERTAAPPPLPMPPACHPPPPAANSSSIQQQLHTASWRTPTHDIYTHILHSKTHKLTGPHGVAIRSTRVQTAFVVFHSVAMHKEHGPRSDSRPSCSTSQPNCSLSAGSCCHCLLDEQLRALLLCVIGAGHCVADSLF